jgi:hypothetical protein
MTIHFPGDAERLTMIRVLTADYFDFARRLLCFWVETEKDEGFQQSGLPHIVLQVLLSMGVKACRQFRSVIELCERGEAADAAIIARAMFETALVVGFVLKPRFCPRKYDSTGKVTGTIGAPGIRLTRERRAALFVAHHIFQPERFVTRHINRPGIARHARSVAARVAKDEAARAYKKEIGPGWEKILMSSPYTYSGLSIANLARSLGKPFPKWYDIVYSSQSEHVHAADLQHYTQMSDRGTTMPDWHGSPEDVCRTLQAGISMFYAIVGIMNEYVKFGIVMNTALHAFHQEYRRLVAAK